MNVCGSEKFDIHHPHLIPDSTQRFNAVLHGNTLGSKDSALNSGLFLCEPINHEPIQKDHEASAGTTISLIPSMVRVNKHPELNIFTQGLRDIQRLGLFAISIEASPVSIRLELGMVNVSIGWIKN